MWTRENILPVFSKIVQKKNPKCKVKKSKAGEYHIQWKYYTGRRMRNWSCQRTEGNDYTRGWVTQDAFKTWKNAFTAYSKPGPTVKYQWLHYLGKWSEEGTQAGKPNVCGQWRHYTHSVFSKIWRSLFHPQAIHIVLWSQNVSCKRYKWCVRILHNYSGYQVTDSQLPQLLAQAEILHKSYIHAHNISLHAIISVYRTVLAVILLIFAEEAGE